MDADHPLYLQLFAYAGGSVWVYAASLADEQMAEERITGIFSVVRIFYVGCDRTRLFLLVTALAGLTALCGAAPNAMVAAILDLNV